MTAPDPPPGPAPARLAVRGLGSVLAGPFELALRAGECLAIAGESGAGKSLFLRMLADLDPNEGEVRLDGVERRSLSGPQWRRRAPYVAAESGWWLPTAAEHFAPDRRAAAQALAGELGLGAAQFEGEVARLSTGERQRLAIVRALVLDSPVLLLDEPTGPLDPASTGKVEALLRQRMDRGAAIVLVSHDPAQAERLGAQRLVMRDRRLEPAR